MATQAEKKEFINRVWNAIAGIDLDGLFPSILIAQAALESNWGQSGLSKNYNNFFGIKAGSNWNGKTTNMLTKEHDKAGNVSTIKSNFRVYDSLQDSIIDRNKLFNLPRYAKVKQATTPEEQIQAIKDAGYATAVNYVSSVLATVNANDLKKYDELKKKR